MSVWESYEGEKVQDIRWTWASEGRLSRCRLRVREEKRDREGDMLDWGPEVSRFMRFGLESIEEVVEISESDRLRLMTILMSVVELVIDSI